MVQIRSDSPRGGDRFESVVLHKEKLHPSHRNTRSTVRTTVVVIALSIVVVATYHVASNPEIASSSSSYSSRTTLLSTSTSSSSLRGESSFQDDQCRFYLAESAIPRSGLGLFTAIDLEPGQQAQSMADICLYVADTPRKTHFETHSWAKDVFFGLFEGNHPRAACEGFATLFNSMPIGVQTSKLELQSTHDNAGLHRHDDAGAGAVSQYYGISSTATRHVNAGSELTIDYGDWPYDEKKEYVAPVRTVPWLREHGMCIDNIRIRQATDPSMGRGAFAARKLQKGQIVSPAPLQFFADRQAFANQVPDGNGPEPLFVNYCLSIGDTPMMLFPYGPGVNLINHASATKKSSKQRKPNVQLQWSTHGMSHSTWLDLPLSQYREMDYPGGLILDVVALRDIKADEELFLDYGDAWQAAWDEHVQNWTPPSDAVSYVYPQDMDLSQPFRTVDEQVTDPYADNLATVCWTANWERDENSVMKWTKPTFDWPEGITYCNIQKRTKNDDNQFEYEVSLNFDLTRPDRRDRLVYVDTNVPHSAIWFVDKPYQSDMHLANAFRHPIALPDQLIPKSWLEESSSDKDRSSKSVVSRETKSKKQRKRRRKNKKL